MLLHVPQRQQMCASADTCGRRVRGGGRSGNLLGGTESLPRRARGTARRDTIAARAFPPINVITPGRKCMDHLRINMKSKRPLHHCHLEWNKIYWYILAFFVFCEAVGAVGGPRASPVHAPRTLTTIHVTTDRATRLPPPPSPFPLLPAPLNMLSQPSRRVLHQRLQNWSTLPAKLSSSPCSIEKVLCRKEGGGQRPIILLHILGWLRSLQRGSCGTI